jgi:hypothetical protein
LSEAYADGLASHERLKAERRKASAYVRGTPEARAEAKAAATILAKEFMQFKMVIERVAFDAGHASPEWAAGHAAETQAQVLLAREVFANPFRPVRFEHAWRSPAALTVAQAAYDERILPPGELDPARLAVLADALEEAGCTDAPILAHLRGPGPHVRGCWALDLILGKG